MPDDDNELDGTPLLYQVDPFRAPLTRTGPLSFIISGANFKGPVEVTCGGAPANVETVSPKRIKGKLPDLPEAGPLDVVVTFPGGVIRTLQGIYHFVGLEDAPQSSSASNCVPTAGQTCSTEV